MQKRWNIPDDGAASQVTTVFVVDGEEVPIRRRFIPARVTDNPHLPAAYQANLMAQSDVVQKALLGGRWDVLDVPGAIYKTELDAAKRSVPSRVCRVPYDPAVPVHVAWDLGISDSMVVWCAQIVGREIHLIDYYEASGEAIPHFCEWLDTRPYRYGDDLFPHDGRARELGTGKSREEVARANGRKVRIVPNIGVEDGIGAARLFLARCWFDVERCARGLDCLTSYRRDYNDKLGEFKASPVHDWASHGADAFRYLAVGLQERIKAPLVVPMKRPMPMAGQSSNWMR